MSNIEAAKAVADAVRTSLGPRGMDKMVSASDLETRPCFRHAAGSRPGTQSAPTTAMFLADPGLRCGWGGHHHQ